MTLDTPSLQSVQEPTDFASAIARAEFGRNWLSPAARAFRDVTPQQSLAARKATRFGSDRRHVDIDLADAFARVCREMEAAA